MQSDRVRCREVAERFAQFFAIGSWQITDIAGHRLDPRHNALLRFLESSGWAFGGYFELWKGKTDVKGIIFSKRDLSRFVRNDLLLAQFGLGLGKSIVGLRCRRWTSQD